ncbi:S8 family serine peptidase [Natrinema thermotolerans]|uniref:S8 family serine peptidase n=1 Tax=Natrinema thermotolerans TaxID=121872 RepID=A0AAF0PBU0_9EURY|nr:S8 family serine peptidase [Natrinema thermotolerans]QCC59645.1 peptidase S8 [Natrinema thermotolerans]WMT06624.1 S8 family serine peptidase [Natrinema thermotolerans]
MVAGFPRPDALGTLVIVFLLLVSLSTPFALGVAGSADPGTAAADDSIVIDDELPTDGPTVEVVVRLTEPTVPDGVSDAEAERRLEAHAEATQDPLLEYADDRRGLAVEERFWLTNAVVLEVDTERVAYETFDRFDAVEAVHENIVVSVPEPPARANATTSSPTAATASAAHESRTTNGIAQVNAPAVWDEYDARGEGVRVAVLDTGVDPDHPDIDLATEDPSDPTFPGGWAEFDATGQRVESVPHDTGVHGTHVSGTVAGGAASGTAIGVAPDAELLHGLVLNETSGTFAQIVAGMEWAVERDADVLSMSFGATGRYAQLIDPVRNARASGVVVVGAVGNEGPDTSGSPGNVYETLTVGAVDSTGTVPPFSGGEHIAREEWVGSSVDWTAPSSYTVPDVVAPGVAVTSATPGGGYESLPGTSMATPHVSGTAALLLSIAPDATPTEIEAALTRTARVPADADSETIATRYGAGIVDASAAADTIAPVRGTSRPTTDGSSDTELGGDSFSTVAVIASVALLAVCLGLVVLVRYRPGDQ